MAVVGGAERRLIELKWDGTTRLDRLFGRFERLKTPWLVTDM